MNTQYAKIGKTYPKPTPVTRKDDPWKKYQVLFN